MPCDILFERDVSIPTRNGDILLADIYRPADVSKRVPIILSYTMYGKKGGFWNKNMSATAVGVPASDLSGLQSFEAPDPGRWVPHGYAIVYVDAAGTGYSGGDYVCLGEASGKDIYDVIEWLGAREWSNGKVGMNGNSYLTANQWAVAALQPPHLAAIAPWEGFIDIYRETAVRGGIPDTRFWYKAVYDLIFGQNMTEDMFGEMLTRHPLFDRFWADKCADLSKVSIPAYVTASWTNVLHSHGTLQGFRELGSKDKWLRVHNVQEWIDISDPDSADDLRKFFDRYLKGIENDWENTPKVRMAVLDPGGSDIVGRVESEWPLARQQWQTLYLDAGTGSLTQDKPSDEHVASYVGDDLEASVKFSFTASEETEITGYLNLHLWVEAADATDMDLFAALYKEDSQGKRLHHICIRNPELRAVVASQEKDGKLPATFSYTGPLGRLRVSHRELDTNRSTPSEPYLSHKVERRIEPGEAVPVELSLWPTSMLLHAGERLVVEIAGHPVGPLAPDMLPGGDINVPTRNHGEHRIRTGGRFDSHLLLPVVP